LLVLGKFWLLVLFGWFWLLGRFKGSWGFAGFREILVITVVWLVLVIGFILFCCSFGGTDLGFMAYGWCCFNELCYCVGSGSWILDL
jgi:hypothetical protein